MSLDDDWDEMIRQFERQIGRPFSAEQRAALENAKAKIQATLARNHSLLDFMQKLIDRQGTVFPDFEKLYRKKAAIDRKMLDP